MDRIYKPIEELSDSEIHRILESGDINELIILPLSIGQYHHKETYTAVT